MGWWVLVVVAWAQSVDAEERVAAAEARRLTTELLKYAADGKTGGVERQYSKLLALGTALDPTVHVLAAQVAQERGDSLTALGRLQRVPDASRVVEDKAQSFASLVNRYGYVRISVPGGPAPMEGPNSFAPHERLAVDRARDLVARDGHYLGLLPAGDYAVEGYTFVVEAGKAIDVVVPKSR